MFFFSDSGTAILGLMEGHILNSCWEHSDFSFNPSMPVSLSENHHLSQLMYCFTLLLAELITKPWVILPDLAPCLVIRDAKLKRGRGEVID